MTPNFSRLESLRNKKHLMSDEPFPAGWGTSAWTNEGFDKSIDSSQSSIGAFNGSCIVDTALKPVEQHLIPEAATRRRTLVLPKRRGPISAVTRRAVIRASRSAMSWSRP